MMAINFPAAAFLASLKSPSQNFLYCISQDTGAPVVVYKDSQNIQQSVNVPPWSNHEIRHEAAQQSSSTNSSTIRVEAGNQVATIQIPQLPVSSQSNVTYTTQPATYYSTAPPHIQTSTGYIQVPGQVYAIHSQEDDKNKSEASQTHQHATVPSASQHEFSQNLNRPDDSDEGKTFSCSLCKKSFRLKSTLIQHERIHLDTRPYVCNYDDTCRKSFRQKSHLIQHSRIHFDSKPFPCTFEGCGKSFRQRAILSQHERIHCDASSHLLYKNVGENGTLWPHDLPYPNEIQPKDNASGENHQNGQFPQFTHSVFGSLTDVDCQKTEFKPEMSTQQTSMPLYVRCPICQVSYKQKSTLLQHGCIHIESRPYPCLYMKCGKRFRQQSHLAQHVRIHRNEKPYRCPYIECQGRCFRQKTILNQHLRIHTNSKPYRCSLCGKDFRQQAILSQHEKTHQSHRPYSCPLSNCKRRFINEHDLKKHIENHMNPTKTKKQSRTTQIVKPEIINYLHHSISHSDALNTFQSTPLAYQPASFNQPLIPEQQQAI